MPFAYDRALDPHRDRGDVHYRLYRGRDGRPTTICVQWFDYFDYRDERFLSYEAFDREADAERAATLYRLGESLGLDPEVLAVAASSRDGYREVRVRMPRLPLLSLLTEAEQERFREALGERAAELEHLMVGYPDDEGDAAE